MENKNIKRINETLKEIAEAQQDTVEFNRDIEMDIDKINQALLYGDFMQKEECRCDIVRKYPNYAHYLDNRAFLLNLIVYDPTIILGYKEKIWVLYSCDVQDNTQLKVRNAKMLSTKQDLENRQQALSKELDSLVAIYTKESTDSLEYYKKLKTQLPQIRDSVVNVVKTKYQYQRDSIFNNWLKNQTASVRRAAAVIRIDETRLGYPNSAGGCDYHLYFTNLSTKTIKYLRWSGLAYNRVNDPAYCEIRRTASCSGYYTGPIAPKNEGWGCWDCIVYNYAADTVKLNSIAIDYTDGSHFSLSASDIRALAKAPRTKYVCIIGSEEDRAIDAAKYSVISDETCEHKIEIWKDRVDQMKYKNFWRGTWEDIYHDKQYDEVYKRLGAIKSEIAKIKSEIERFEKFINFESY